MKLSTKGDFERVTVGVMLVIVLISVGWSWHWHGEIKKIRASSTVIHLPNVGYQPVGWPASFSKKEEWLAPPSQSTGDRWIYELFTPPAVFYDGTNHRFTVTGASDPAKTSPSFPLELIAVRRELYRVQLGGYFGEPGAYTAVLSQPGKPEALFAKQGTSLADQGLTLRQFSVHRTPRVGGLGSDISEPIALAELHDER